MDKRAMKQQRIENILLSLKRFSYLTRSQIQQIHNLKGDRNANRFLNSMDEYLSSFRHGMEKVYYLNKLGRERVGCTVIRKKTPQIQHYLLRNQAWIYLGKPVTWDNEVKIKAGEVSMVCDAKYTAPGGVPVFVEVDVSQPMSVNSKKANKYKEIQQIVNQPFRLVWITELETRRKRLADISDGLQHQIYTLPEIR